MTTTTLQPITDASVPTPDYYALAWDGGFEVSTSTQISDPIEQGATHIWQLTERQFNLWNNFTKEIDPDTNTLSLTFSAARHEHLHDLADGEPSNNRHLWRHAHRIWRNINELRYAAGKDELYAEEADALYRELHGRAIHCFIDGLSDIESHVIHESEEKHKFAEKLADAVFAVIVPTDENGVVDWTAAMTQPYGYVVPTGLRGTVDKVCAAINNLENLSSDSDAQSIVRDVVFNAEPRFAPSMQIAVHHNHESVTEVSGGQLLTTNHLPNTHTVTGSAEFRWETRANENAEWTVLADVEGSEYTVPQNAPTGVQYRATVGGYFDLSGAPFERSITLTVV